MKTIYTFASNLMRDGRVGFQAGATALQRAYEKRHISYYRTDGIAHRPIEILDQRNIDPFIKQMIEEEPDYEITKLPNGNIMIKADRFMIPYFLKLATPSEFIRETATILHDMATNKINIKEIKPPKNIFIGLEHYQKQLELRTKRRKLENFTLEQFLRKVCKKITLEKKEGYIDFPRDMKINTPTLSM